MTNRRSRDAVPHASKPTRHTAKPTKNRSRMVRRVHADRKSVADSDHRLAHPYIGHGKVSPWRGWENG